MPALQRRLLSALAPILALQSVVLAVRYVRELGPSARFGGDFVCFWQAAVRARHGELAAIYRPEAWRAALAAGSAPTLDWFVYPPFSLLGLQLLGGSSYGAAAAWWSLAPLPAFLALLFAHARRGGGPEGLGWRGLAVLAGLTSTFLVANMLTGQSGTLMATLFLAAAWFWPARPLIAGVCIGLLALKPQLGLLIPFALAAEGRLRTAAAAAATVAALVAGSLLAYGPHLWRDYLQMTALFGRFVGAGHGQFGQLALSPYVSLRGLGAAAPAAIAVQALVTATVLGVVLRAFAGARGKGASDPRLDLRLALLATGALLATPYALTYETPLLALAVASLFVRAWRRGCDGWELAALTAMVLTPYAQVVLAGRAPFGFLAVMLAFAVLSRRHALEARVAPSGGLPLETAVPEPAAS